MVSNFDKKAAGNTTKAIIKTEDKKIKNVYRDVKNDLISLEYPNDNNKLENKHKINENEHKNLSKTNVNYKTKNFESTEIEPRSSILQSHIPLKTHVSHKPTVEDTSRVYNPYPIKNEYEKYSKNGFIFEPLKPQLEISIPTTISKENSFKISSQNTKQNPSKLINANVNFSSELLSPYKRNDIMNEKIFESQAFYTEAKIIDDDQEYNKQIDFETEFKNYNNSKLNFQYKDINFDIYKNQTTENSPHNKNFRIFRNIKDNHNKIDQIKNFHTTRQVNADHDKHFIDEYDIANKLSTNKSLNQNLELINSINEELKKIKTGYLTDYSNA